MSPLTLYNFDLDENCYCVRLALGFLGREARLVAVDMVPGREHEKPPLIDLNPGADLPILVAGEIVVAGPLACLAFLARSDGGPWRAPADPAAYAAFATWLEFAAGALAVAREARAACLFGGAGDLDALVAKGRLALRRMEDRLTLRRLDGGVWFVGDRPTLVDIALFPVFALSRDWGVGHEEFPALRLWLRRFRALPGFRVMPGVPDYH